MTSKVDRDSGPCDCCKRATVLQHSSHLFADPRMNPSSSTTNLGALGQAARQALQNWLHIDTLNWPGPETLVTQLRWSCHLQQPDFEAAWHMRDSTASTKDHHRSLSLRPGAPTWPSAVQPGVLPNVGPGRAPVRPRELAEPRWLLMLLDPFRKLTLRKPLPESDSAAVFEA